ncbi:hypothetical protein NMG60_11013526 [Bertholletia excelsa]
MDDLPQPLILEILSRLDSFDLARCQIASRTLYAVAAEVRSIDLHCSYDRYTKSRSPETSAKVTPFKVIFKKLVSSSREVLESVSLGVEKPLRGILYDDVEDESDDLYLMDVNFVAEWLSIVAGRLKSISISDFWIQSCWRRSDILSLISSCCHCLLEIELKNAWLSVDRLNQMPMITSLTLEFIRLDDEDLAKVKELHSLKTLRLEAAHLCSLVVSFPSSETIKNLKVDSPWPSQSAGILKFSIERLFDVFPNVECLTLGPGAWLEAETWFCARDSKVIDGMKGVKNFFAHLFVNDVEVTLSFILYMLEKFTNLTDMALLIHRDVESSTTSNLMSRCMLHCAKVKWRWGLWKEGMEDAWVSDGI